MPENETPESGRKGNLDLKRFSGQKKLWIIILSLIIVATVCFLVLVPIFTTKSMDDAIIRIPANANKGMVRDSVAKYLGDDYASLVMRVASMKGSDFSERHGAYLIPKGLSPVKAERKLSSGAQQPLKIVINGFRTPKVMAEKIAMKLDFTPDSLLNAMKDPEILDQYGITAEQAMVLFPDATYEVYWSTSPEELIEKTGSHFKHIWNSQRLEKAKALGLSPAEIMTLCSIVDEETNKADDKGKIGRLYINRLQKGIKLQADPTVKYAVGDFSLRRIKGEHLKKDSPYNTYIYKGLPPGPIRTTGEATIDSVLNSAPNDYIYMCAKDDFSGYHAFASNYDEHLKNARNYQKALNRRGIK